MNWIRIRRATKQDISAIMALEQSCFTLPWNETDLERDITANILSYYLIAESADDIIGYGGIWVVEDECHIMTIAVAPECRQAGIGAMMLMKLMDEARLRGASRFFLEVRVSNAPAIAMYEKFGFIKIDLRKAYYEDNKEDAAVMYKEANADNSGEAEGEAENDSERV
jgi:ribosomal-protein-alanine N-acetyltransferase